MGVIPGENMERKAFLVFFFTFCFLATSTVSTASDCVWANEACSDDGFIDAEGDILSIDECRNLCVENEDCEYFSYHGLDDIIFFNYCELFSNCTERVPCEGCITEKKGCTGCGSNVIGKNGGNVISQIRGVESANACFQECENEIQCKFYTYFNASHESYAERCLLLSDILGPFTPCKECFTGPLNCNNTCSFAVDNDFHGNLKLKSSGTEVDHRIHMLALTDCQLRIIAVGGGGKGGYFSISGTTHYFGGGGGSGQVSHLHRDINPSFDYIDIYVGESGEATTVKFDNGTVLIDAAAGGNGDAGDGHNGGSGYCGGGRGSYNYIYRGGTDGGDGEGSTPGQGSGLKIKTILLNHFKITPGAGGYLQRGGGGGGIIVDGIDYPVLANAGQGVGYGGGGEGAWSSNNPRDGHEGIVLLEIMKKR